MNYWRLTWQFWYKNVKKIDCNSTYIYDCFYQPSSLKTDIDLYFHIFTIIILYTRYQKLHIHLWSAFQGVHTYYYTAL